MLNLYETTSHVEDDVQIKILSPNSLIYELRMIPEDDLANIIDKDLRKRALFIKKCKEAVWSRWRHGISHGLNVKNRK